MSVYCKATQHAVIGIADQTPYSFPHALKSQPLLADEEEEEEEGEGDMEELRQVFVVGKEEAGQRLDRYLSHKVPDQSRTYLTGLITRGLVKVNK